VALAALVIFIAALAMTYVPGGQAIHDRIIAAFPHATETPNIDDAQAALDSGDAAGANKLAQGVVATSSSDATIDNHAGNIAVAAGDDGTAKHDYEVGEAADARNGWNYVALGQLYARQKRYSEADAQLRAALALVPDTQFLHYDLGVVELNEHLPDAALSDFNAELKRSPTYQPAIDGKIQALGALGRTAEAQATMVALNKQLGSSKPGTRPTAHPSPSPSASASPLASPSPTAAPSPTPSPTPLPIAQITPPSPTPTPLPPPTAKPTKKPAIAHVKRIVTPPPSPSPTLTPTPVARLPQSIADLAPDAKGYLFEVAGDPGFGGELPFADPTESVARMQATISKGTIDQILSAGTAAMLSHHFTIAAAAFSAATARAGADWRGPYLAGINAQQRGDQAGSRPLFSQAASRGGPAAVYVAQAVADVAVGDDSTAYADAQHAVQMSPSFGPALFTAGMIDILVANVPSAERDLTAAAAASGAPARTSYFLQTIRSREQVQ
jgi:tetratricopeptide (TPR) repeat protein